MGDKSAIEWTDATWNPLRGCTRVSEGCRHCYAEAFAARFSGPGQPYEGLAAFVGAKREARWTGKIALAEHLLDRPLRWRKPRRIFVNSMSDLFHESVPDEWIDRIFAIMALCPQHRFQVLTKRPERMRAYMNSRNGMGNSAICAAINRIPNHLGNRHGALEMPLPNLWLGVSVEDQATADERIPLLLDTPAAKRFISAEPLLGPLDLSLWLDKYGSTSFGAYDGTDCVHCGRERVMVNSSGVRVCEKCERTQAALDWVIVGGENGPRPCHPNWVRRLRDQCAEYDAAFYFKQWGTWWPQECNPIELQRLGERLTEAGFLTPTLSRPMRGCWDARGEWRPGGIAGGPGAWTMWKIGKKAAGAMLDGREHREFPE